MSLGSDKLGKDKAVISKGLADGVQYKTDVYSVLDELFHDDGEEIVVSTRNKYFAEGAKKFLEDMNFTFLESDLGDPRMVISLINSNFKFIDHMEDLVSVELPYEWDDMENKVREYVSANPVVKKEINRNESSWGLPTNQQGEKDAIDGVKDWVREIQKKINIGSEEAASIAKKHIRKLFHSKNETTYTALGNPDLKIVSGMYNNIEDLIVKNGWKLQFESDYKMTVREYLRNHSDDVEVELNLLSSFGFEYLKDDIRVTPNKYWTNRIIEIRYKDQDNDELDSIEVDESEFQITPTVSSNPTPTVGKVEDNKVEDIKEVVNKKVLNINTDEVKYKRLKTYRNETPIFIVGCDVNGKSSFSLTSDYSSFDLRSGSDEIIFDTDGDVSILSLNEFKRYQKDILSREVSVVLLPNMKGDIGIGAVDDIGQFTTDFDLFNYIYHDLGDNYNVIVDIPVGVEMVEVNEATLEISLRKIK